MALKGCEAKLLQPLVKIAIGVSVACLIEVLCNKIVPKYVFNYKCV